MKDKMTAPEGGTSGDGINDIGSGERDNQSIDRSVFPNNPRTLANIALVSNMTWHTGQCAGCNHQYRGGESFTPCFLAEPQGVCCYTLCEPCTFRWPRDRKFRRRLEREAYRSLFNAGPDDVGGSA